MDHLSEVRGGCIHSNFRDGEAEAQALSQREACHSQTDFCPGLFTRAPASSVDPSYDSNGNNQVLSSLLHFPGNFFFLISSLFLLTSIGEEVQKRAEINQW